MISLQEEYIGTDAKTIIVWGLKVCGGVLCNLNNGNLLGAHFSSRVTPNEILTGCNYLMNHFSLGAKVTEMYFLADLHAWQDKRKDKYANTHVLIFDLKLMFRYDGTIKVNDTNIIFKKLNTKSVDVRFDAGTPAIIRYRATLNEEDIITPSNNVKYIYCKSYGGQRSYNPVVKVTGDAGHLHRIPADTEKNFKPFSNSMFVQV